ncbi:MAG: DUF262 domain-containing protein, partial [Dactylosporangium sp.]|nr:DUF262 domain-containing protein [Dactylosporangium sp.]
VTTKTFSLRHILDLIEDGDLELAPDFQRNRVWKARQKSRLIESILLQIPLPAFYFAEDADSKMRVVDGLQRLSTVLDFVRGTDVRQFPLADLEYLKDEEGRRFAELQPALQRRINNTQIIAHVIDPTTPATVTYNIFKRLNTGGTPLNAQEIRHCMSKPRSREFLRRCAAMPEFDEATGGSLRNNIRMGDREAVLRFCAFRLHDVEAYRAAESMDAFLLKTTHELDDPKQVDDANLTKLQEDLRRAMRNAIVVFGQHAFRKWWGDPSEPRNPINRPLFESWSVALADLDPEDVARRADKIRSAAKGLMEDNLFFDAITTSTGGHPKVAYRLEKTFDAARVS